MIRRLPLCWPIASNGRRRTGLFFRLFRPEGRVKCPVCLYLPDYNYTAGFFVYTEAVVTPFTHQPGYFLAATEYPLPLFLQQREFAVGQVIAYLLPPLHSKRNEGVSPPPKAQRKRTGQFVRIETSRILVPGDNESRSVVKSFLLELGRLGFACGLYQQELSRLIH